MVTPAIATRVEQGDASTGAAIESFDRITFEEIATSAGKGKIGGNGEAPVGAREDMLHLKKGLADQVLIASTILATAICPGFYEVTELMSRRCHLA